MSDARTKIAILTKYSYAVYFASTFVPLMAVLGYLFYALSWTWTTTAAFVVSYLIIYVYGINIFYHRYWSHKQFNPHPWVLKFFTVAGTMAMIGGPTTYAMAHRWHHAHSDTDLDPHSPAHGRWHAFIGWTFTISTEAIPVSVVKDFFIEKNNWLFHVERTKMLLPWILVIVLYAINPYVCMGVLSTMFLTHLIELYINAFLHDVNTMQPVNINPVIGWLTAGGLTHKLHHDNPGKTLPEDPGYFLVRLVDTNKYP